MTARISRSLTAPPRPSGRRLRPLRAPLAGLGLAAGLAASTASAAPPTGGPVELSGDEVPLNSCKKRSPGKKYTITVPPEAELEDLVKWMSTISCQKFIWNGKVRSGKVTILSPEPVSLTEAYAAFYAALEGMGLTVEPAGDYFKIVETADAKSLNLPMYEGGRVPNNDRFVTQLVRVKSSSPEDIAGVLNKIKSKTGSIEQVGNLLIISDRGSTVRRLMEIVKEIDEYGTGEKVFFYQLQYAQAAEVAEILREIFGETGAKSGASAKGAKKSDSQASFSRVIVDERTGTLIIVSSPSDYDTIRRLIEQLDVRLPGGGGRIHVKPLKNSDPKEIAAVLQALASGSGSSGGNAKGKQAPPGGESAELFSGEIKVTADENSRSLVIVASAADYRNLEEVIDELDAQRAQVYLEIYLLEANISRDLTAGAGGHVAFPFNTAQGQGVGLVSSAPSADVNSLLLSPQALSGLAGGALGPLLPGSGQLLGLGQDIPSFGVIIQALQVANDTNVVAEPHVMTADNREVQLEVGQRVPTPGALSFGGGQGGASFSPLQSVNREDVTLNIKVTPHINDSDTVTLDVELEDRDIVSTDPTLGVTTTKRRFKLEHIMAEDDQPIVLGGLIRERERENVQQVPGLGQIPILGWLFKRKQKIKEKVNLLVIMVPHVVDSPDDVRRIHERRTRERMEFLERETSFKRRDLATNVNYRSKSGMLSTVDREARRIEREELLLRQAEEELDSESITGELGQSFEQREAAAAEGGPTPRAKPARKK